MASEKQYIDLFNQMHAEIDAHSAEVMNAVRSSAFAEFERMGFPTTKVEKYKYTDVDELFAPDYGVNVKRFEFPVNPYDAFKCNVPNMSSSLYFVVNDSFYDKVQPNVALPEGVIVDSLSKVAQANPDLVARYYSKIADSSADAVTAFNTAFVQDGVFVYVPRNVVVSRPIQLVNILRSDVDMMVNRRVLIVVEDGAQLCLLTCDHAMDERNFLATQVIEAYVGNGATLDFNELEETHTQSRRISNTYLSQQADSTVKLNSLTLHNGTTRNMVEAYLVGRGASLFMNGMAIEDKNQHVDNNTFIEHRVSDCQSNELYKYVLNDSAVGAFAGTVLVDKDAQRTVSNQTNQNICASKSAHMYTQPQLIIYADDVKCSHGATVGQLDENALFYMQQRGIPFAEANMLMQFAFVGQVINQLSMPALKERLHQLVELRFRGELTKCKGCSAMCHS